MPLPCFFSSVDKLHMAFIILGVTLKGKEWRQIISIIVTVLNSKIFMEADLYVMHSKGKDVHVNLGSPYHEGHEQRCSDT